MALDISAKPTFTQIHNEFKKTGFNQDKSIRSDGNTLYTRKGFHNLNPSAKKLQARQAKHQSGATAIRTALERQVGKSDSDKILRKVGLLTGVGINEAMATRLKRSDLNKIQAQVKAQAQSDIQSMMGQIGTERTESVLKTVNQQISPRKLADGITNEDKVKIQAEVDKLLSLESDQRQGSGKLDIPTKNMASLFRYDTTQYNGLTEIFLKDAGRASHTVGDGNFSHDKPGVEGAVREMFKDNPKMLAAVSQICHQGSLADCEGNMLMTLQPLLVAEKGKAPLSFDIQQHENGDVTVKVSYRAEINSVMDPTSEHGGTPLLAGNDSYYSYDATMLLKKDEVASGKPQAHVTDSNFSYQINPGPPTITY